MVGYSAGLTSRRSLLSAVVLVVALGAVITIVVDLDRPREGFIQVSQQPLIDLQRQIGPPSPRVASGTAGGVPLDDPAALEVPVLYLLG